MADITQPAPECPECGGARFWYGSVEFHSIGSAYGAIDHPGDYLNVAACSNCGYSSLYLQNMQRFQQSLLNLGFNQSSPSIPDSQMVMSPTPERREMRAIHDALRSGNKIQAIKLYRELYGCGLREAKDAIEVMERK